MTLTVTDLFCGAGGSSSGAELVPGVQVRMAANHWKLAVDTHNTNLPHADHATVDLHEEDPRYFPRTDILWASPECTKWSKANGRKPLPAIEEGLFEDPLSDEAAQRSRLLMFDVFKFAEHHRYRAMVIENVVDIATRERYRLAWKAWQAELVKLGYEYRVVSLNSMHAQALGAPAPQSRDRLYIVCWQHGERAPDIDRYMRPRAWCTRCETVVESQQAWKPGRTVGCYRQQYVYIHAACGTQVEPAWLPAAAAIDWTIPGQRIGDRSRPLAPKTRARIAAGLRRYARPVHLEAHGNTYERPGYHRSWPVDDPFKTFHTTPSKGIAYSSLLVPVEGRDGKNAATAADVFRTQTARNETGLAIPMLVPAGGTWNDQARTVDEPMRTRTTLDTEAIVIPMRANNRAKDVAFPLDTVAAAGNHHALLMRNNSSKGDGGEMCTPVDEVARTITTTGHQSLVCWDTSMVMRNMTARGDQGQMSTPVSEPLRTTLAEQLQSLIRWDHLIVDYNGSARRVTDVLPTQTTVEGDGLASPAVDVDDCYFRMLEPHEIAAAMAFAPTYVLLGNKRERVRLAGNAVTPPAARDLIAAVAEALTGLQPLPADNQPAATATA
jgi:DNA (cytosine-5)-methyltransferase 1